MIRGQRERMALALSLLEGLWEEIGDGEAEDILQEADKTLDDWVRVIRCKDCEHFGPSCIGDYFVCYQDGYQREADDFCSWGERR